METTARRPFDARSKTGDINWLALSNGARSRTEGCPKRDRVSFETHDDRKVLPLSDPPVIKRLTRRWLSAHRRTF
jgi:hypothetical protein